MLGFLKFSSIMKSGLCNKFKHQQSLRSISKYGGKELFPEHVDWREENALTPVKDQGNSGACTIFATVAAVESYLKIQTGKMVPLSIQHVFNNMTMYLGKHQLSPSIHGMDVRDVLLCIKLKGITTEEALPYTGVPCLKELRRKPQPKFDVMYYVYRYKQIKSAVGREYKIQELVAMQPVIAVVDNRNWPLEGWHKDKILSEQPPTVPRKVSDLNHVILIVGYGTQDEGEDKGTPYWLIRNSYGPSFGNQGYVKIRRDCNCFGIALYVWYVE